MSWNNGCKRRIYALILLGSNLLRRMPESKLEKQTSINARFVRRVLTSDSRSPAKAVAT
jgi:hypothetical protein